MDFRKKSVSLTLLFVFLLAFLPGCTLPEEAPSLAVDGELQISYLDVGQGDSALLLSPQGKSMLIDGGLPKAYPQIEKALQDKGVKALDVVVVTHPHQDHMGAIPQVLENYPVKQLYINGKSKTKTYEKVLRLAQEKQIPVGELTAGGALPWDEAVKIDIAGPFKTGVATNLNNESPIMRFTYNGHRFLFTGDAEIGAEDEALAYNKGFLKADVLKVGHHGSATSSMPAFALAVKPRIAIISVGQGNKYGHPDQTVVTRWQKLGALVYTTEKNGPIEVSTHDQEIWVQGMKNNEPLAA